MKNENIYKKLNTPQDIAALLALDDFSPVYEEADRVRREAVGDVVHLRAIIEFSNVCRRQCRYCGLNCRNEGLTRYRMSRDEILQTAKETVSAGYRTIVLQSGEDAYFTAERLGEIIAEIKGLELPDRGTFSSELGELIFDREAGIYASAAYNPAVTVSCGERPWEDYRYWRKKGADRYLLKHETADPVLYDKLHPCGTLAQRIDCLKVLYELGYETGSGFMVGLPGQTLETLGRDLLLLKEIPCHMAGIGPFIANPKTELAGAPNGQPELARRAVAIARLLLPEANLPLTTALSILTREENKHRHSETTKVTKDVPQAGLPRQTTGQQENPFAFGANVIMKKVTPDEYKSAYEIYPADFQPTNIAEDRRRLEQVIRFYDRIPI